MIDDEYGILCEARVDRQVVTLPLAELEFVKGKATLAGIAWLTPVGYEVRWTKTTLDRAHPVYQERCQRDEIDADTYWLEEGEVEAAPVGGHPEMEQLTNLATRPHRKGSMTTQLLMALRATRPGSERPAPGPRLRRAFLVSWRSWNCP